MVRNTKAKRPSVFASTLKIFSDRASSNRTEHASGEGSVHAFSIRGAQIQAALTPAAKSVPGMRRRDHSCRDWVPPCAR